MSDFSNRKKDLSREAIIGLGERSIRKNYYPELQEKVNILEKMRTRNQALITAIPDVLLVSDDKHRMTPFSASNAKDAALFLSFLRDTVISARLIKGIDQVLHTKNAETLQFESTREGITRYFEARLQLTEMDEVLIIIRDMTERITLENTLRHMAETDSATGLYNRRKIEDYMTAHHGRTDINISLILFDIDGLKSINDTLGHVEGNAVINRVAETITRTFQAATIIGRIGGNEFAVIYEDTTHEAITALCLLFQGALDEVNQALTYDISVSFGIAHSDGLPVNTTQLYQMADHNIYNAKLLKEGSSKSTLVKALMKALEAKDYITEGHADRMGTYALRLGEEVGLERHRLDMLVLLTKFHDLGKVGIPDSILKKAGPLTPEEWIVMKTHTTIGHRIASASPELLPISDLIHKHHEKWDGTGYPLGLSGEDIPIECRILAIVDSYDAMTNDRPYRLALSHEEALKEIQHGAGTQFDPTLARRFVSMLQSENNH